MFPTFIQDQDNIELTIRFNRKQQRYREIFAKNVKLNEKMGPWKGFTPPSTKHAPSLTNWHSINIKWYQRKSHRTCHGTRSKSTRVTLLCVYDRDVPHPRQSSTLRNYYATWSRSASCKISPSQHPTLHAVCASTPQVLFDLLLVESLSASPAR